MAALFLAYQPALSGYFIWDDDAHVTRAALRSWPGLYRIWFDPRATYQYYPLLHSAFWVQHRLFGDEPSGYHLTNILLHGLAALLVARLLRRLAIPGAYLAAALFALHPVQVESVAWITEEKNTLSALFYLGAALVYLRFDQTRKLPLYLTALGLFGLGLLSKTITATLPGALLVIFWWQRGRLSWKRDVLPLVPFFLLGAVAGLFTAWVERKLIGAEGTAFQLSLLARSLLAGRAIWFYLGKLVWPANLLFIYPRWHIDPTVAWQYLFPAAALVLVAVLWRLRRRWRGPLAGFLFFVGTLFPALGFLNVYPFRFSFVADHFQYLASLGGITLAAAGIALALQRWGVWGRPLGHAICLSFLTLLATLTWRQCQMYADPVTLYQTTLAGNPDCWMAYTNLAGMLANRGYHEKALRYYEKALQIYSDAELQTKYGERLDTAGRTDEAVTHYQQALQLDPRYAPALSNLGIILARRGQIDEAQAQLQKALDCNPRFASAHVSLGQLLTMRGKLDEALAHYRTALDLAPDWELLHNCLGLLLEQRGETDEAIAHFQEALALDPYYGDARRNLDRLLRARKEGTGKENLPAASSPPTGATAK